jgi:DNA-binding transcriptional ArsR family regulator
MATPTAFQVQSQLLRTVSHPVRLQILSIVARQEACVCHLEAILHRPQPYVSKQLAALRDAGLVSDRRDGTLIYYRAADEHIAAWLSMGRALLRDNGGNPIPEPTAAPETLERCPCPRCQG